MKCKLMVFSLLIVACQHAFSAPYIQDTGKIKSLYVNSGGTVAITLDNGFANAISDGQCSTSNGYGGNTTADPAFKSVLIAAKAAQQTVTVTVQGCEAGGAWFKIIDVYVN